MKLLRVPFACRKDPSVALDPNPRKSAKMIDAFMQKVMLADVEFGI